MFKQTNQRKTNKIKRGESPFLLASYGGVLSEAEGRKRSGKPWFPTESPFFQ